MSKTARQRLLSFYLWVYQLVAEFIEGFCDMFLKASGGMGIASAAPADVIPGVSAAFDMRAVIVTSAVAGLYNLFAQLKKQPLPPFPYADEVSAEP